MSLYAVCMPTHAVCNLYAFCVHSVHVQSDSVSLAALGSWFNCKTPPKKCEPLSDYESWVVPAGVPSALADIGGGVEANN